MAYTMKRKINDLTMCCKTSTSFTLFEKQLLLPALYGLNRSFTKKIIIGFEDREEEDSSFYPATRLVGNDFTGISFNIEAWQRFQEHFDTVSRYLDGGYDNVNEMWDERIVTPDFSIFFTMSYGQKAIVIEKPEEELRDGQQEDKHNNQQKKESKKKKLYHCVVMQKVTFDNLKEICDCVNERLNYLEKITMCVNKCKDSLIKLLHTEIGKNGIKADIYTIKNIIKTKSNIIENQIREDLKPKYPSFIEREFRIIFLELTTIYQFYISRYVLAYG